MADNTKGRKKITIDADTISTVMQRYSIDTILALFKEMAQDADEKMDWKELVRKSNTGITNAREYQMVWRYLAYGMPLEETVPDAEPLDDDSDLDCEVETMPPVSPEVSAEAAACVKVLIASDLPSKSSVKKGLETMPAATTTVQLDSTTNNRSNSSNLPPRWEIRRRWSDAEDKELIASVQRYGEGNWTYISQGEYFDGKRTASQLYKRWTYIKKHKALSCLSSSSQLSATRHALSLALDMPVTTKELKASSSQAGKESIILGLSSTVNLKAQSASPDELVRSTAVAVGARIGTSDDAASLAKAAQGNNVVHYIRSGLPTQPNSAHCHSTGKQLENRPGANSLQLNNNDECGDDDDVNICD